MNRFATSLAAITFATLGITGPAITQEIDEARIGEIVRQYLLENPEILVEMEQVLETRRVEQETKQRAEALATAGDRIFRNPADPVLGNPDGDVTIVEFFDYNCGFCRRAHQDLVGLLETDRNVRVVMKEFPILGPDSQQAHLASMAFQALKPDAYGDFLNQLITHDGRANLEAAIEIAALFDVAEDQLRAGMDDPAIIARVQDTYEIAGLLGITGTPTYVIGDEVLGGAVGLPTLSDRIKNMRDCNAASC